MFRVPRSPHQCCDLRPRCRISRPNAGRVGHTHAVNWIIWVGGGAVLVGAGVTSAYVPRMRAHTERTRAAWAAAKSAIAAAGVSRDACPAHVPEADRLLAQAEALSGGPKAARTATDLAERADRLWREARDE